jgi:hypothetical protein
MKRPSKVAKRAPFAIRGSVVAAATRQPIAGISVTATEEREEKRVRVGRAVTKADGSFSLALNDVDARRKKTTFRLALTDAKGRPVLDREHVLTFDSRQDVRVDFSLPRSEYGNDWPDIQYIQGQPVNIRSAALLRREELVQTYRFLRGRGREPKRIALVKKAFPALFSRRPEWDDCGTNRLAVLRYFLIEKGGDAEIANSDDGDLPPGATIHWFYTASIAVKYTTDANVPDAVPAALPTSDTPALLADNVTQYGMIRANLVDLDPANTEVAPEYVQRVGLAAEYALGHYLSTAFGVRDPRNGAARQEYRILKLPDGIRGETNQDDTHIEIASNNNNAQILHASVHELFHRVQFRYTYVAFGSGIFSSLLEGGARFIEDCIDDASNRWADSSKLIFQDPTVPLTDSASVSIPATTPSTLLYAASLFWKYLAEQHSLRTGAADEPAIGIDAYRKVLEVMANILTTDPGIGYDPPLLRVARRGLPPADGLFDEFQYLDPAQTELTCHETTWGNYLLANYLHGTGTPLADRRFDYMEDDDPVLWPNATIPKLAALQSAIQVNDDLVIGQSDSMLRSVTGQREWAARYYRVTPSVTSVPRMVTITFTATGTMTDPLVQVIRLGANNAIVDIHRSESTTWTKTIDMSGLDALIVIVASRANAGDFDLQFDEIATAADTMVTRWNSRVGTEYEVDPRGFAWTWVSPDIMVDNDNDGMADTEVFFGQDNTFKVRLRNRGNLAASNLQIDFWYQKCAPTLSSTAWLPMQDLNGVTQQITNATLAAGAETWFSVNWAPVDDGSGVQHWCVKVKITAPGELNTDNKLTLSNFGHVITADPQALIHRLIKGRVLTIPHGPRWRFGVSPHFESSEADHSRPLAAGERLGARAEARAPMRVRAESGESVKWDGKRHALRPAEGVFYPVDKSTLPPGVSSDNLVTIVQEVDGRVIGGVTFSIGPRRERSAVATRRRTGKKTRSKRAPSKRSRSRRK